MVEGRNNPGAHDWFFERAQQNKKLVRPHIQDWFVRRSHYSCNSILWNNPRYSQTHFDYRIVTSHQTCDRRVNWDTMPTLKEVFQKYYAVSS